jgi:hypothetical protein
MRPQVETPDNGSIEDTGSNRTTAETDIKPSSTQTT